MRRSLIALALLAAACSPGATANPDEAGAAPATKGQPFRLAKIATFATPWALSVLPDSTQALVSEKDGKLWRVDLKTGQHSAIAGLPTPYVAGQGGLGDVVIAPDFATSKKIWLSWVEGDGNASGAVVAHAVLDGNRLTGMTPVWRQSPKLKGNGHFGHRILIGRDGLLYISSGERQKFDPAQDMGGNLGKIIRLTQDGQPAPGNPWAKTGGIAATFYSIGHRNPLGIAFDADGRLWNSEMGPAGGDELNLVEPGKNYGYPKVSNGSHYDGRDIPDHAPGDGFAAPAAWWNPAISPSGLLIYKGRQWPWTGHALIPGLSGQGIARVILNGAKASKADYWDLGMRVRAIAEAPDGTLYILEDNGSLYRLDKI